MHAPPGSALLQQKIYVFPRDSPTARQAAARVQRPSFPPAPGLVAVPLAPVPLPPVVPHRAPRSRKYVRVVTL